MGRRWRTTDPDLGGIRAAWGQPHRYGISPIPGSALAQVRREAGYTQAGLAAVLGVPPQSVSRWETTADQAPCAVRTAWWAVCHG